jgi:outer membrane protein assembly factor BamB
MISISVAGLALSAALAGNAAPSTLPESWVVDTKAPIHAPVSVHGDLLFVGNQAGQLLAMDVGTGKLAWSFRADGALDGQATVDGGEVFVQSRGGLLYSIALEDGRELWRSPTGETGPKDFWDFTLSAPVLHAGTVVLGSGSGHLNVYSRETGALEWQFATNGPIRGTPVLVGDTVYFGSFDGHFTALDLVRRELVWQFKTLGSQFFPEGAIQGSAVVDGDLVHVGSRDYNLYVLDRATGRPMWNLRAPSWVIGGPALDERQLYFGTSDSRRIYAVNRRTGDTAWTFATSSRVFGSPVVHQGIVYFASFDGRIHGLDAATGEQRHVHRTRGGVENHGLVYAEDGGFAESFRDLARSGAQMEAEALILKLGSIGATPSLADGKLLFGSTDGHVYALELPAAQ